MFTVMSSPIFSNAVQDSVFQVISEGGLKAVARPLISLQDKNGTPESRKYYATKELIFQLLSMGFYGALVIPIVKKGGYQVLKKMLQNKPKFEAFKEFANAKAFSKARDAAEGTKNAEKFIHPKGAIEAMNMLGSGVILTILAPQVVTRVMHPIMGGVDKMMGKKQQPVQKNQDGDTFAKTAQAK